MNRGFADLPAEVLVAVLLWGEARGEPVAGQIAVGCVVRNRAARDGHDWWGVCLAPKQFSCFNDDDVNRPKVLRAADQLLHNTPTPVLRQCLWIAEGIISNVVLDNTDGAQHYMTTALLLSDHAPKWAIHRPILAQYGAHSFLV